MGKGEGGLWWEGGGSKPSVSLGEGQRGPLYSLKVHPSRLGEGPEGGVPPPSPPARTRSVSCWGRVRSTRPPRPLSLPSLTVRASLHPWVSLSIRARHTQRTPVSPHPHVPPALIRCTCHDRASLANFGGRRRNGACSGGGDRRAVSAQCGGRCCHGARSGGSDRSRSSKPGSLSHRGCCAATGDGMLQCTSLRYMCASRGTVFGRRLLEKTVRRVPPRAREGWQGPSPAA